MGQSVPSQLHRLIKKDIDVTINTTTINSNGTEAFFEYAGGPGAAIVTGDFDTAYTQLEFSLDDTNYAPIGAEAILFQPNGFAIGDIPACRMRWVTSLGNGSINLVASVESKA